jgi:S1-C subfamily serine protease
MRYKSFSFGVVFILTCIAGLPALAQESINLRRTVTVGVVEKTKNAVVNISATKLVNRRISPFEGDPFWQNFDFGDVVKVPASSLGSGFIIHPDGYVVTNNHVIDRARSVTVELADGRKLPADLVSADADADLAILKIESDKPFPALTLGDSSDLLIGEPVIAVGNPFGFSHSVSTGIVSAIHRDLKNQQGGVMLGDLVQTDAAINPGNSGGPLLNAYGQVIGINTAIRGDAQNIGFAIQVNKLRDLIPELLDPARVAKVDLPVHFKEVRTLTPPATVASAVEFTDKIEDGRFLRSINGHAVKDIIDAYVQLLRINAGDEVKLVSAATAAGNAPADNVSETSFKAVAVNPPDALVKAKERLGLTIEVLTPMLAEKYHLQSDTGLFVTAVARDSAAAKAGVQTGDVIIQLGRYRVATLTDFATLLQHLPETGRVRLGIIRGDKVGYAVMEF